MTSGGISEAGLFLSVDEEKAASKEREGMGHVDEYNHVMSCRFMSCHVMYNNYGVFFFTRGILALMSDAGGLMR